MVAAILTSSKPLFAKAIVTCKKKSQSHGEMHYQFLFKAEKLSVEERTWKPALNFNQREENP